MSDLENTSDKDCLKGSTNGDEEPLYYRSHKITPERFGAVWRCRISGSKVTSVFGVLPTRDKVIAYAKKKIDDAWVILAETR